ncbi:MAG: hypothetical protein QXN01_00105 [Candidatus Anstonellales archaeon]
MDEHELKERINVLLKEKATLSRIIKKITHKISEQTQLSAQLKKLFEGKENIPPTKHLYRIRNQIEFKISTEAYTPKIERALISELNAVDRAISESKRIEWIKRKHNQLLHNIEDAIKKKRAAEDKLSSIKEEIHSLILQLQKSRSKISKNKTTQRDSKGKRAKFPPHQEFSVSLGDICVIEHKSEFPTAQTKTSDIS